MSEERTRMINGSLARASRAAMVRFDTIDRAHWSAGFEALRKLGFDAVDLPWIWSHHDRGQGPFDFDVAERGARSLAAALRAARDAGLRARVRLGPRCVETEPGYGVPRAVLAERDALAASERRGLILEPVAMVATPAPSLASERFRKHCERWIAAAVRALGHDGFASIDAIVLGAGTFAPLRADAIEGDHHPDAGPIVTDRDGRRARAVAIVERWYEGLVDAARREGAPEDKLRLSLMGPRTSAVAADALSQRWPVDASVPFASAGTSLLWSEVRRSLACSARGVHFDVQCGSAPFARPLRNRDAAAAARVVLAAGARSITVRYAWCGAGWVGSLLDPRGAPLRVAARWSALFDECSAIAPDDEREPRAVPAPPTSSWLAPLSAAWLAQYGLLPERDATSDASARRFGFDVEPEGAVLARSTAGALVLLSASHERARLRDPQRRWLPHGELSLEPGAVAVLREGGAR